MLLLDVLVGEDMRVKAPAIVNDNDEVDQIVGVNCLEGQLKDSQKAAHCSIQRCGMSKKLITLKMT